MEAKKWTLMHEVQRMNMYNYFGKLLALLCKSEYPPVPSKFTPGYIYNLGSKNVHGSTVGNNSKRNMMQFKCPSVI